MGATDNFTLSWANDATLGGTCASEAFPPDLGYAQDARRIPSFSGRWKTTSIVKPDMVAPGTRITGPKSRSGVCGAGILCNPLVADFGGPGYQYAMSAGTSFSAPAAAGAGIRGPDRAA